MKKVIGIVGGLGPASTVEYYNLIATRYHAQRHDNYYPKVIIYSVSMQQMLDLLDLGRMDEFTQRLAAAVDALDKAGADFALIASNTPHCVFEELKKVVRLPLLSIVSPVVKEAQRLGLRRLLLLGTRRTMQEGFYQKGFEGSGIELTVPALPEQDNINDIIFNELVISRFVDASRRYILDIIGASGCDGAILGCTELPLLITQEDRFIPCLDTLSLHVDAALQLALDDVV